LAEEQKTLGSQRAQKGDRGRDRQRSGEAWQGWAQTDDLPQLLALAGDLHCPKASLSASATFLICSTSCPTLTHPGAGSGCLDTSLPRSFPDAQQLTHTAHGGTEIPEPGVAGVVHRGWLGAILPRHRDQSVLAGTPYCLQNPLQFTPQPAPAGRHARADPSPATAPQHSRGSPILTSRAAPRATPAHPPLQPFEHLGPAPSSPHGSHLGCPSPQMEPIGNRGHHHPLPWTPPQPRAVEKIEVKIAKLGWLTKMET